MAFDLQDLSELEKRFEHVPTELTQDYEAHKAVVNELVSTAKNLLSKISYGQEAESFVTKLVSAGEEIHNAIDKAPPGASVALGKIISEPLPRDEAGVAPVAAFGTVPEAPASA